MVMIYIVDVVTFTGLLLTRNTHAIYSTHQHAGYWRLLDLDYRDQVFQRVLTLLEEEDWSYKRVPLTAACEKLEELEPRSSI